MAFDPPPPLSDAEYSVLPMTQGDRATLIAAAGDPLIWAGHPAVERYRPEVFEPYFDVLVCAGGVVTLRKGVRLLDVLASIRSPISQAPSASALPSSPANIGAGAPIGRSRP